MKQKTDLRKRTTAKAYLYLMPMLLLAAAFYWYPALQTAIFSVTHVNARGQITGFAGLENFKYTLNKRTFSYALQNTLQLALINTPLTIALSLGLAALTREKRAGSFLPEWLYSLPMVLSMSACALAFKVILNPRTGPVNVLLGINCGWLEDRGSALYGILTITVWMGIGFNYLVFLSGLRALPQSVMEAAGVDGAGRVSVFFRVRLPLMLPTVCYAACNNLVLALLTNGPIILLTDGGPVHSTTTLIFMMYSSGYGSSDYSLAACVSMIAFIITIIFLVAAYAMKERWQYE